MPDGMVECLHHGILFHVEDDALLDESMDGSLYELIQLVDERGILVVSVPEVRWCVRRIPGVSPQQPDGTGRASEQVLFQLPFEWEFCGDGGQCGQHGRREVVVERSMGHEESRYSGPSLGPSLLRGSWVVVVVVVYVVIVVIVVISTGGNAAVDGTGNYYQPKEMADPPHLEK